MLHHRAITMPIELGQLNWGNPADRLIWLVLRVLSPPPPIFLPISIPIHSRIAQQCVITQESMRKGAKRGQFVGTNAKILIYS